MQLGDGKTESTQAIPDFPYHKYAELIGLKGIFCDDPEKIGAAWDEALAADRPVILEMYADPNVPPLPPHITLKDAKNFMTMMRDEPELGSVLKNSGKQVLAGILPRQGVSRPGCRLRRQHIGRAWRFASVSGRWSRPPMPARTSAGACQPVRRGTSSAPPGGSTVRPA